MVERNLAKVEVASSNLVSRSKNQRLRPLIERPFSFRPTPGDIYLLIAEARQLASQAMPLRKPSNTQLRTLHQGLCFQRAFPQNKKQWRDTVDELDRYHERVAALPAAKRLKLADSGIAGTVVYYRFSFDVARWLAQKAPGAVCIDWDELDDTEPLDELLRHLLQPAEDDYFSSGYVSTREWIDVARSGCPGTDFDWLLAQLEDRTARPFLRELYDTADIPLVWALCDDRYSKSKCAFSVTGIVARDTLRPRPRQVKKEIQSPLPSISRLSRTRGSEMVDVAMASLAARHRETYHFNFANPDEVYLADVGEGISIAVFGLLPDYRFALECTMGYLILSNGVPIGYGGASVLFKQVNTGINIFAEYRGSEASYLWVQVMRVYHALVGCTRFIASAYQLGDENPEALKSGAFWFYYRLGYRPLDAGIRRLASREETKRRRDRDYRSPEKILKRLVRGDMHLALPGNRTADLFNEEWLASCSRLATERLATACESSRKAAVDQVASELVRSIGVRTLREWTKAEYSGLRAIAPFIAAIYSSDWTADAKRTLRKILRTKGGPYERIYAKMMAKDDMLLQAFRIACIKAESP